MNLRDYLRQEKMSQAYIANVFNCTTRYVEYYISGRKTPSHLMVQQLVDFTEGVVTHEDFIDHELKMRKNACRDI
jgi:predicted transcriptional regulator